jgi:hypothetical protein
MSNSPTPPAPQLPETEAAELAKRLQGFTASVKEYPWQARPLMEKAAAFIDRQSSRITALTAEAVRLKGGDHCSRCGSLLDNESPNQDDDQWFCPLCRAKSEVVRLTEAVAGMEHPIHRDTTEPAMRLRNWMRDYGSEKNPQFIDDLTAVLDENASIRASNSVESISTPTNPPVPITELTEADLAAIDQRIFVRGATQHDCQRLRDALKSSREREQWLRGALEKISEFDAYEPAGPAALLARAALAGGGEGENESC